MLPAMLPVRSQSDNEQAIMMLDGALAAARMLTLLPAALMPAQHSAPTGK